jgi:hypothetical protein
MNLLKKRNIQVGLVILIFGVMTLVSGGRAIFTEEGIASRGHIVPLVLVFNFIAGFFYFFASILTFKLNPSVKMLAIALAVSCGMVWLYLIYHILHGGLYEHRTLVAMSFRTIFWVVLAIYFRRSRLF